VSDKSKTCPQCGGAMAYRLGEYQCGQCDHVEPAVSPGPSLPAAAEWRKPPQDTRSADAGFAAGSFSQRDYSRPSAPGAKFDPAPTLNTEKMIFFGVFLAQSVLSIAVAGAFVSADPSVTVTRPGWLALEELVSLGLLVVVLYVPFVPLKWCCASYSCAMVVLVLAGLFLGELTFPPLGLDYLLLLVGVLKTGVYSWFASILYRDIQKLKGERESRRSQGPLQ
jgi:hypothetical protein